MTRIYGITNCDTVRKAKKWLDEQQIDYQYVDFRKNGLTLEQVRHWADSLGTDRLLNRRGTTWRSLDETAKQTVDEQQLQQLMLEHPALIKRPVLEHKGHVSVGFNAGQWQNLFE